MSRRSATTGTTRRQAGTTLAVVTLAVLITVITPTRAGAEPTAPSSGPSPSNTPCPATSGACHAGPTPATVDPNSTIPGAAVTRGILDRIGGVVGGASGGIAEGVIGVGMGFLLDSVTHGTGALIGELAAFTDASTHPRVTAREFLEAGGAYHAIASISVVLLVGFVFLGVIQGLVAGEPGQAMLRLVRDIPVAVLAIAGFPWLIDQLLGVTDALSAGILPSADTTRKLMRIQLLEGLKSLAGGGVLPALLIGLLTFAAVLLVFLELLVRNVVVYLVVALAPLSYAALVWPAARGAARKIGELVAAVILSKPAIFLALRVGLDLVGQHAGATPGSGGAWGKLLVGLAAVCVAAFTPWVVWRLLPQAEGMLAVQGLSRGPGRTAMTGLQTAYWIGAARSYGRARGGGRASAGRDSAPAGPGPTRSLPDPGMGPRPAGPSPAPAGPGGGGGGAAGGAATAVAVVATAAGAAKDRAAGSAAHQTSPPSSGGGSAAGSGSGPPSSEPPGGGTAHGWSRRRPRGTGPGSP